MSTAHESSAETAVGATIGMLPLVIIDGAGTVVDGFVRYGRAPDDSKIAGRRREHPLFQVIIAGPDGRPA